MRCTNSEPGTFGHECGKAATWKGTRQGSGHIGLGIAPGPVTSFYCSECKAEGFEAARVTQWERA